VGRFGWLLGLGDEHAGDGVGAEVGVGDASEPGSRAARMRSSRTAVVFCGARDRRNRL
jgi:hypothetical protein